VPFVAMVSEKLIEPVALANAPVPFVMVAVPVAAPPPVVAEAVAASVSPSLKVKKTLQHGNVTVSDADPYGDIVPEPVSWVSLEFNVRPGNESVTGVEVVCAAAATAKTTPAHQIFIAPLGRKPDKTIVIAKLY